jgi:hypothetical protein
MVSVGFDVFCVVCVYKIWFRFRDRKCGQGLSVTTNHERKRGGPQQQIDNSNNKPFSFFRFHVPTYAQVQCSVVSMYMHTLDVEWMWGAASVLVLACSYFRVIYDLTSLQINFSETRKGFPPSSSHQLPHLTSSICELRMT